MCNCRAGPTKARVAMAESVRRRTREAPHRKPLQSFLVLSRTGPSSSHPRLRCIATSRCSCADGRSCGGNGGLASPSSSAPVAAFLVAFARGPIGPGVCRALVGIQTSGLGLGLPLGLGLGCGSPRRWLGCWTARK